MRLSRGWPDPAPRALVPAAPARSTPTAQDLTAAPGGAGSRRTRIVCTLGPATAAADAIARLVDAGMDVARLNFSHGTREEHAAVYGRVREASDAAGRAVGILADLQGPKIRLGCLPGGFAVLEPGEEVLLVCGDGGADDAWEVARQVSTTYPHLASDVAPGGLLLIDDGLVKLEAVGADGTMLRCRVIEGGMISDRKGINLPGARLRAPVLTSKDLEDLRFALALGVDMVALSFVRRPEDAEVARLAMDAAGRRVPLIAKLEKAEAVARLDEVARAFDGLMVARGDLGVEVPMDQVPLIQKQAITLGRTRSKPVIVATQMLESMRHHSRPTRAEVSDVANAVLDGADAVMLSAETSVGQFPTEAVAAMASIVASAEGQGAAAYPCIEPPLGRAEEAIAAAAPGLAREVDARAIVVFTETGATARRLAMHRPPMSLLAFTRDAAVRSRLAVTWGVETFVAPLSGSLDEMVDQVSRSMLDCGRCRAGDVVVIVAGSLPWSPGATDLIRVHRLADVPVTV
ncbi:MAG: pyruvate kinase [Actinomycetota bacterium]